MHKSKLTNCFPNCADGFREKLEIMLIILTVWHAVPRFNPWLFIISVKLEVPLRRHPEIMWPTVEVPSHCFQFVIGRDRNEWLKIKSYENHANEISRIWRKWFWRFGQRWLLFEVSKMAAWKIKNITEIEHTRLLLFTLLVSLFRVFLAQKLIYTINMWFNFAPGSFFWSRSSAKLNYFRSSCKKMT